MLERLDPNKAAMWAWCLIVVFIISLSVAIAGTNIEPDKYEARGKYQEINISPSDIVRVYDGDTFYITLKDMPPVFGRNIGVRIKGIDTPEVRSSCDTDAQRDTERASANDAKAILKQQLMNAKVISLQYVERDKYFRLLADVKVDGLDVTEAMKEAEVAVPYFGGRKVSWCK